MVQITGGITLGGGITLTSGSGGGGGGGGSISYNWIVGGAPSTTTTKPGSAYVYDASNLSSTPTEITASDSANNDRFGSGIAVREDVIVIGARKANSTKGAVYVFDGSSLGTSPTKLTSGDSGSEADDDFGVAIAIGADWIVVGAPNDTIGGTDDAGSAYVFDASNLSSSPTKIQTPTASRTTEGKFGQSVAVVGDTIYVGSQGDNGGRGAVYVFDATSLSSAPTKITASDGAASDYFGRSIDATSTHLVVGAYNTSNGTKGDGSMYVYDASNLSSAPTKVSGVANSNGNLGWSVALNDDYAVATAKDGGTGGTAWVYDLSSLGTSPTELTRSDAATSDFFGWSVAINDNYVIVGSMKDDIGSGSNQGSVYIYTLSNLSSSPTKITVSGGENNDRFGMAVGA